MAKTQANSTAVTNRNKQDQKYLMQRKSSTNRRNCP